MNRELCLMRGINEGCLISLAEAPGRRCVLTFAAGDPPFAISIPLEVLEDLREDSPASLAGADHLCRIERDRSSVRFQFASFERRTRCYEVDAARFEAALVMLSARSHAGNAASLN